MLTKIALLAVLSLLATLVAGPDYPRDHITKKKDEREADTAPDTVPGYMLVYQKGYCGSLGKDLGRDIYDPAECFRLAQGLRATAFSMGRKYRKGMCSVELLKFTRSNYEQWQVCVPPSRPQHMHALWPTPTRASHDCATSHAVRLNPSHNVCLCLSALSFFDTRILTHPTPT